MSPNSVELAPAPQKFRVSFVVSPVLEERGILALDKDAPEPREVQPRPTASAKVVTLPRVVGIHQRYEWNAPSRFAA